MPLVNTFLGKKGRFSAIFWRKNACEIFDELSCVFALHSMHIGDASVYLTPAFFPVVSGDI